MNESLNAGNGPSSIVNTFPFEWHHLIQRWKCRMFFIQCQWLNEVHCCAFMIEWCRAYPQYSSLLHLKFSLITYKIITYSTILPENAQESKTFASSNKLLYVWSENLLNIPPPPLSSSLLSETRSPTSQRRLKFQWTRSCNFNFNI